MGKARIVYIGAVQGSLKKLRHVREAGGEVVGVVGLSETKAIRHADYVDLACFARAQGIAALAVEDLNAPETLDWIRDRQPDFIFLWGWSQLVAAPFLALPPKGVVGFHPALLPENRGRHPVIWPLALGLDRTGASFFFMDEGADSGDILAQREIPIAFEDDAAALMNKIDEVSRDLIFEFVPRLNDGTYTRIPQDHGRATYLRKRTREDGRIDWDGPAEKAYNLVRALARPYPGAVATLSGRDVIVYKARLHRDAAAAASPGEVFSATGAGVRVAMRDGVLELLDVIYDGLPLAEAVATGKLQQGMVLQ
ncbi:MAG: methionyl-tRNA formyltransferase [Thermodesulfobacteriota bacterium]